jgi:hypothetical protein
MVEGTALRRKISLRVFRRDAGALDSCRMISRHGLALRFGHEHRGSRKQRCAPGRFNLAQAEPYDPKLWGRCFFRSHQTVALHFAPQGGTGHTEYIGGEALAIISFDQDLLDVLLFFFFQR